MKHIPYFQSRWLLALMLTALPFLSYATDIDVADANGNVLRYQYSGTGAATVTKLVSVSADAEKAGRLIIPATITDGDEVEHNVTSIYSNAFHGSTALVSVSFPSTLTSIGYNAFYNCDGLTAIELPDALTSLGTYAFYSCDNLASVDIGSNLTAIANNTFQECTSLATVTGGEGLTSIGDNAFYNCDGLTAIELPDGLTSLGSYAFQNCDNLASVDIGSQLATISQSAFENCTSLTTVTGGEGVTRLNGNCFRNTRLTKAFIPDAVTTIENYVFRDIPTLTEVVFGSNVESISSYQFRNSSSDVMSATRWVFNGKYTSIPDNFLSGLSNVTEVVLGSQITSIGSSAFNGTSISSITLPDGLQSIGSSAFANCAQLAQPLQLPDGLTILGDNAFQNCSLLPSVVIGSQLATIGQSTFENCTSLTTVTGGEGVTKLGSSCFRNTRLTAAFIPDAVTTIENYVFRDIPTLQTVVYGPNVESISTYQFRYYSSDPMPARWVFNGKYTSIPNDFLSGRSNVTEVELGSQITSIGSSAFNGTFIQSITLPEGLKSIGNSAFANCTQLAQPIQLPDGLTTLGDYAFQNCSLLPSVDIGSQLATIGQCAFQNCTSLTTVTGGEGLTRLNNSCFMNTRLTEAFIPDAVTTIENHVFRDIPTLTTVVFGPSVASISRNQFQYYSSDQTRNIERITFNGTYTSIPESFTVYFKKLREVTFGSNITAIGNTAFQDCDSLRTITITDNITTIGNHAFDGCDNLATVNFGTGLTSIGEYAFYGCKAMTAITFPTSLRTIGQYAFQNCDALETLTVPEGVTTIGYAAFNHCDVLREVTLPTTVTTVDGYAFDYSDQLQKMTLPMSAIPFKSTQDFNSELILFVPAGMVEAYQANNYTKNQHLAIIGASTQFTITTTEGGQLQAKVEAAGATASNVMELTVTGPINGTDINYLHQYLVNLHQLDLGNAQIVTGGDSYYVWSLSSNGTASHGSTGYNTEANIIGRSMFANMPLLQRLVLPQTATEIQTCGVGGDLHSLTDLVLPAALTTIGDYAFAYNSYNSGSGHANSVRHLTIPSGVLSIGTGAFYRNYYLEEITIPNGVTVLPASVFSGCTSLKSITLPNALTTLGGSALYNTGLQTISLPSTLTSIGSNAFAYSKLEGTVTVPGLVEEIGEYAFSECDKLEHVVLSEGVTRILNYTFQNCDKLASISLPSTLTSIGNSAFYNDPLLNGVTLPAGLTSLGTSAFYYCKALEEMTFPAAITEIPTSVLEQCTSLRKVTLAAGTTKINNEAFYGCSALTDFNFLESLTYIGSGAFYNTGFTTVTLPNSAVLYNTCFANCANLEHINIPTATTYVPTRFVQSCAKLTQVDMHDGITQLNDECFEGCTLLPSIVLNNNITSIGNEAFHDCINLVLTALPTSLQTIGSSAFNNCDGLTTLEVPASVTSIGGSAFAYSTLTGITLPTGVSLGGFMFNHCTGLTSVQLPSDLKTLPYYTFSYCSSLQSITLPAGLTKIDYHAFEYCSSLSNIPLPAMLQTIEYDAFRNCSALTTITLPESLQKIGSEAFYSSGLTSITIPDGVTQIDSYAFAYCQQMTSATLGRNQNYTSNSSFDYFFQNQNMQTLRLYAGTVPQINSYYAPLNRGNITLEVPMGTQDLYGAASVWNEFKEITTFLTGDKLAAADYAILQAIYNQLDGANWTHVWDLSTDDRYIGKWYGVTTEGDHIVSINLAGNNLTGTLTQSVFELTELTELNLSRNHLSGQIDAVLANDFSNDKLTRVVLYDNQLIGDLYPFASKLPNLTYLSVSYNRLSAISQPISKEKLSSSNLDYSCQFIDYATKTPVVTEDAPVIDVELGEDFTWTPNSLLKYNHSSQNYNQSVSTFYWCYTWEWWYDHSINLSHNGYHDFVLNDGHYTLSKNRTFTGTKGQPVIYGFDGSSRTVIMRINWIDGDINSDRTVDVADLQGIVYYALTGDRLSNQAFNFTTADVVTDEMIDVRDVVMTVNRILDYEEPESSAGVRAYINHGTSARNVVAIERDNVRLANADAVGAIQLTIIGQRADDLTLAPDLRGFTMAKRQIGDDTRVVIYNMEGQSLPEGEYTLLNGIGSKAAITAVRITDAEANYLESGVCDIVTEIETMDNGQWSMDNGAVYDLSGRRVQSSIFNPQSKKGVYIVNGKKTVKK